MKGILFGGCSFTWGQGLYFYSNLPHLYNPTNIHEFLGYKVTPAQIHFKNTIRYPRIVANHFNTFEIVRTENGGSDDETFDFFRKVFTDKNDIISSNFLDRFDYNDFDYIIIQLSGILRNKFNFTINQKSFSGILSVKNHKILEYMKTYNFTFEDCYTQFLQQQFDRLKTELMFYESKGIKSKIVLWFDDLYNHIKDDDFLKNKVVVFNYKDTLIYTIKELQDNYSEMLIVSDPYFKDTKFNDAHPSKLCHNIIANGIISSIQNDII